jgi:ketosteroid isomerase-like protein
MKKSLIIMGLILCLGLVPACKKAEEEAQGATQMVADMGKDIEAIRTLLDEFDRDINAGEVDRLVERQYTEDAVRMPAAAPMLRGKASILAWFKAGAEGYNYALHDVAEKVHVENDFAYTRGSATGTITPKAGGDVFHVKSKWIAVYEKQADGSWKVICDIFNNDGPDSLAEGEEGEVELIRIPQPTFPATGDVAAIKTWLDEYTANNNAGGSEAYGDFWMDDVTFLPPGAPAMYGKQAILDFVLPNFTKFDIDQKFTIEDIRASGKIGYARISGVRKYSPKAEGKVMEVSSKSVFLFRKQADGTWKGSHCIWNSNR